MLNKKLIIAMVLMLTLLLHNQPSVYAEVNDNVLDCIENDENCLEQDNDTAPQQANNDDQANQLLQNDPVSAPSLAVSVLKMIVGLFFVLGLIYLILIFLRKKNTLYKHSDMLENLGGISLGQNKSLQLIRLGTKIYLVGVGERVELVTEVTEEEVLEKLLAADDATEQYSLLKDVLTIRKKANKDEKQADANQPVMQRLQKELNKLRHNRAKIIDNISHRNDEHV